MSGSYQVLPTQSAPFRSPAGYFYPTRPAHFWLWLNPFFKHAIVWNVALSSFITTSPLAVTDQSTPGFHGDGVDRPKPSSLWCFWWSADCGQNLRSHFCCLVLEKGSTNETPGKQQKHLKRLSGAAPPPGLSRFGGFYFHQFADNLTNHWNFMNELDAGSDTVLSRMCFRSCVWCGIWQLGPGCPPHRVRTQCVPSAVPVCWYQWTNLYTNFDFCW